MGDPLDEYMAGVQAATIRPTSVYSPGVRMEDVAQVAEAFRDALSPVMHTFQHTIAALVEIGQALEEADRQMRAERLYSEITPDLLL
jgi:hypothetical protein